MTQFNKYSNYYVPGTTLDYSRAVTKSQFESLQKYARAVPVKRELVDDPKLLLDGILLLNISGATKWIEIDRVGANDSDETPKRNDCKTVTGFNLPHGCSAAYPAAQRFYTVSVEEEVLDDRGKRLPISGLGERFSDLHNQSITFTDGRVPGTYNAKNLTAELKGYAEFYNNSSGMLNLTVMQSLSLCQPSERELQQMKTDRRPDLGGKVLQKLSIPAGSVGEILTTPVSHIVRVLEPDVNYSSVSRPIISIKGPPMNDFVEDRVGSCSLGTVTVVMLDDNGKDIITQNYDLKDIKLVIANIVNNASSR